MCTWLLVHGLEAPSGAEQSFALAIVEQLAEISFTKTLTAAIALNSAVLWVYQATGRSRRNICNRDSITRLVRLWFFHQTTSSSPIRHA